MSESKTEVSSKRRRFSEEFKQDAVRLVVSEEYSFKAAATAVGVSEQTLRHWHAKFAPKPADCGEEATLEELREENKRLRRELRRAELEREILPLDRSTSRVHVSQHFSRFLDLTVRGVRRSWWICWT